MATDPKKPEPPKDAPKGKSTDGKKSESPRDKKGDARGDAAHPPKQPLRGKRLVVLVAIVLAVLAAGAGAAWMMLAPSDAETAEPDAEAAESDAKAAPRSGAAKAAPRAAVAKSAPPVFVALETFTVNLQAENGDHMLQTSLSLKVTDAAVEAALKLHMPEVRSRLLLLLSSKKPSELGSVEGKQALASLIGEDVNAVLEAAGIGPAGGEGPVLSVFFTAFIIQ